MRRKLLISALALSTALSLNACKSLEEIGQEISAGSKNAQVVDATAQNRKANEAKSVRQNTTQSVAQRAKSSSQSLEREILDDNTSKTDAVNTTIDATSGATQNTQATNDETLAQKKALDDEEAALRNTAVDEDNVLPPLDAGTAQEIANLPDYATTSGRQSCPVSYGNTAKKVASSLTTELLARLTSDHGNIFIAPTVIPDEYSDCIDDVSSEVRNSAVASGKFTPVTDDAVSSVAQNSGSAALIPTVVRECRRRNIPYLAVSVVRTSASSPVLTVRIIRVTTGVTLTQSYKKLN